MQRTYGKQASDLSAVAKIFMSDLQEHTGDEIAGALATWRKKSPEFPTPADVESILNPTPVYDKSVYLEMIARRKRNEERYGDSEYMRAYEKQVINGQS